MSASDIKLTYFDIRGLAEIPRLLLSAADVKFTDDRIQFEVSADGKVTRDPNWESIKAKQPYGQVPVLTVGTTQIAQSAAIVRYIARAYGLNGDSEIDAALLDAQFEALQDLRKGYNTAKTDEEKAKFYGTTLHEGLAGIEKNYVSGKKVSYVDVALYYFLTQTIGKDHPDQLTKIQAANPKLKSVTETVPQIPSVAKYLAARKVTVW